MRLLFCASLISILLASLHSEVVAKDRYLVGPDRMTWTAAREYCRQRGGDLVAITSAEKNELVRRLIVQKSKNPRGCWIGASDAGHEGQWRWVNGDTLAGFSNWHRHEPNNMCGGEHYAHMWLNGTWNDQKNDGGCRNHGLMQPVCEFGEGQLSKSWLERMMKQVANRR